MQSSHSLLGINFKFHFQSSFLLSFFYCCFFFVLLLLKLFVAPVEGVATHAVWYLQSGAKQIPWKGHKHFSNWLQHFLSTCCCFLVVTAFYFHMPRGPYCCLLPAATPPACPLLLSARLPACLPACCFCGSSLELWLSSSSSSSPFMRANICALLRIFPSILLVSVLFCHFCLPA